MKTLIRKFKDTLKFLIGSKYITFYIVSYGYKDLTCTMKMKRRT